MPPAPISVRISYGPNRVPGAKCIEFPAIVACGVELGADWKLGARQVVPGRARAIVPQHCFGSVVHNPEIVHLAVQRHIGDMTQVLLRSASEKRVPHLFLNALARIDYRYCLDNAPHMQTTTMDSSRE
jgi:hypothetical protein